MKTFSNLKLLLFFICFAIPTLFFAQNLGVAIDQIINKQYKPNEPGAAVLVAKDGKVVYKNAYGKSNLELDIDMTPENVFEIGSITKQFTAVSILMLAEEGKLSLDDEITKYIPDYPTNGNKITIHHLLTHTSGIKSYTSIPTLQDFARKDLTPTELIDLFKNEPMDFKPGERYLYNNSGYFLLGYIIEKITGESYADFIQKRIFDKLNMNTSYYGSKSRLIKNRAAGYQEREQGFVNAPYISMTIPYAAGSIMSTVEDLYKWNNAIRANVLISKESLAKAFTNYTLNNGSKIDYGYGWSHDIINDVPVIEHGGGIFGYTTHGIYVPSQNAYIILLTNNGSRSPSETAYRVAALAIGKPYPDASKAITLSKAQLEKWVGAYKFEDGAIRFITLKDNQLYSKRKESNATFKIYPLSENRFFFENSFASYVFTDGKQRKVVFKNNKDQAEGVETDMKIPEEKKEIQLSTEVLQKYIGTYKLQPNFLIDITVEGSQIFGKPTGQPKVELFAESEDHFFLKVVAAKITFEIDENTKLPISLTLEQGGAKITGKKVK